jgi:RimJ/RimL family protein N-acetyltransferase
MSLRIVERDFKSFFQAGFNAYPKDSLYVSPMRSDLQRFLDPKNPLFKHFGRGTYFTALRDGVPVGRISAHIHDASNVKYTLKRASFGYFDCADDAEAAGALLKAAESCPWVADCDEIAGPFNLTAMQQMGVVTAGFDQEPYTDMAFNGPQIPRLLEANGYTPFFPMQTFEIDVAKVDTATLMGEREQALLLDPAVKLGSIRRRDFKAHMHAACDILNDAFATNPMFVPLTQEEFYFQAQEMLMVIDESITCLAWHHDKPVGVMVVIPDLNPLIKRMGSRLGPSLLWNYPLFRRRRHRALLLFGALNKAEQKLGFSSAMMHRVFEALHAGGYDKLGVTWVWDGNAASLRQMEKMGAKPLHRLSLYQKALR